VYDGEKLATGEYLEQNPMNKFEVNYGVTVQFLKQVYYILNYGFLKSSFSLT